MTESLLLSRKQRFLRVAPVLILSLCLFPSIGKSIDDLRRSMVRAAGSASQIWIDWRTEWSGEREVLPPAVNDALGLVRAWGVTRYAFSSQWGSNGEFPSQRLIEGLYPARPVRGTAPFFVGTRGEAWPKDCRLLEERGEVYLVACE